MRRSLAAAASAFLALSVLGDSQVRSAQISFTDSVPLRTTNWSDVVLLGKFNSDFGTLLSVTITIDGHIEGNIRVESLDHRPATVLTTLQAQITVTRPDLTTITAALPMITFSDNLKAFDGVLDFGGTSGTSHIGAFADVSESFTAPPPVSDLSLFSSKGGGTISLPVKSAGISIASGTGNLSTFFQTFASASVTVIYEFDAVPTTAVPEPSTMISAAIGIVGLGLARRRATAN